LDYVIISLIHNGAKEMTTKSSILDFLTEHRTLLKDKFFVEKIGLFGSYAKGIDIIVEMPSSFDRYYDLKEFLEKAFNKEVDLGLSASMRSFIKSKIKNEIIYV